MRNPIRTGLRELRNRFITWLDKDTGLPRSSTYFPVSSGVEVTEESAMRVTAVFACVRILSWTLASLPLHVYRRLEPRGKEQVRDHRISRLLYTSPNPEQTSFQFRALLGAHMNLWGNGYAEIEFDQHGNEVALWPIPTWRCDPRRTEGTRELYYDVKLPDGTTKKLPPYRVFHVMGLSLDGMKGLSPIGMAREAVGLSMAAETFGASFFGSGLNPGAIAEHPGKLSPEAYTRLKESMNEKYEGLGKAHRLMLLEEGMKYQKVGIAPEEAQFLETRKFQVSDIARLYGVPPHMVGDTEKSTSWGTGIEQQGIGFVVYTMRPYLVCWEQEISRKLFHEEERDLYYARFLVDGLYRGDIKSRYAAYSVGRQWGWLSANDVRELEDMNPIEGGDVYFTPLNMMPTEGLLDSPDADEAEPAARPDDSDSQPAEDDETEELRAQMDTYGIGVRSGAITPQPEDEEAFRKRTRLPGMSQAVRKAWEADGGVRRPITHAEPKSNAASNGQTAPPDPEKDSDARRLRPVFEDAAQRIFRREEADVMRHARKLSPEAFGPWVEGFFRNHQEYIVRQLSPCVTAAGRHDDLGAYAEELSGVQLRSVLSAYNQGVESLQTLYEETRDLWSAQLADHFSGGTR